MRGSEAHHVYSSGSFRPDERLKKRAQFYKVYKEGRLVKGKNFKLIFLPNSLPKSRIGLSIDSKKIPLSTRRIRVKRFLREAYRLNKHLIKKGFDMIITAGAGSERLDFKKTADEVLDLYRKAGLA